MRITREKLLSLALQETERRASRGEVISGYVIGSLAAGDPLVGGSGDVDLILIHQADPLSPREIVPLSDDVHLDIHHHSQDLYAQPIELRHHPWLGPSMCEPAFLYDPSHFFEWAQASVRGQFHRADHIHARGQAFLERARRRLRESRSSQRWLAAYLTSLLETVNAVASLSGFPAAGRMVAPLLQARLEPLGRLEIFNRFQQLLGVDGGLERVIPEWTAQWTHAFDAAAANRLVAAARIDQPAPDVGRQTLSDSDGWIESPQTAHDPEIALERRSYFLAAFQSMNEEGRGDLMLWPMLSSWARTMQSENQPPEHRLRWRAVLDRLELSNGHAQEREAELEQLQDHVEMVLEAWAARVGA